MRQTSLLAYFDQLESGSIGKQQQLVLGIIKTLGIAYDKQISETDAAIACGLEINVVPARRGELYKLNLIEPAGFGKNKKGRKVQMWKIKN